MNGQAMTASQFPSARPTFSAAVAARRACSIGSGVWRARWQLPARRSTLGNCGASAIILLRLTRLDYDCRLRVPAIARRCAVGPGNALLLYNNHTRRKLLQKDVTPLLDQQLVLWLEVDVGVLPELDSLRRELCVVVVDHSLRELPARERGLHHQLRLTLVLDCKPHQLESAPVSATSHELETLLTRAEQVDALVDGVSECEEAVVLEDAGLEFGAEGLCDVLALLLGEDDPAKGLVDALVVVEEAAVLREDVDLLAED